MGEVYRGHVFRQDGMRLNVWDQIGIYRAGWAEVYGGHMSVDRCKGLDRVSQVQCVNSYTPHYNLYSTTLHNQVGNRTYEVAHYIQKTL